MATDPAPLAAGSVLADRFTVQRVLGRGGFGIAYLAKDESRGDLVVIKELAPLGVKRSREGLMELDQSGTPGHLLRHRFLQEAETLRKLHHVGIPGLRAAFAENGTAYHVTSYLPGGRTLEEKLRREGPLREAEAYEIFTSLLDILEVVHAAGVLHRDVKPSNILLGPDGEVTLLDFGAARDWAAGGAITHTVMHTPGYSPAEQLSEKAARGAATDLYALCATMYHALAGKPPPTAPDRIAGIPLVSLRTLRPDVDPTFAEAIESGLAIRMPDRPESVDAMRQRLAGDGESSVEQSLQKLDETLVRLAQFRFDRRACPACDGMLHEPKPLRRLACPVCRDGTIRLRDLDDRCCPACRLGMLVTVENTQPLAVCPACGIGFMSWRRKGLLSSAKATECQECHAKYEFEGDRMVADDEVLSCDEWRLRSGRGRRIKRCPECDAQYDESADGRWRQHTPKTSGKAPHHWDEWVRLAAGLSPGAGNAACDKCHADYWMEGDRLTLLDALRDPFEYAAKFVGRPLAIEDVRWVGAGKRSGLPGPVCDSCGTEFDRDGAYFLLVESPNRRLAAHVDEARPLEEWHRIALALPTAEAEAEFKASLGPLLLEAYLRGEVAFDTEGAMWRGRATRLEDQVEGTFVVVDDEISFGGRLRRWRAPLSAVSGFEVSEDILTLHLNGAGEAPEFHVLPIALTAHLRSGDHSIELTAEDLAERLSRAVSS